MSIYNLDKESAVSSPVGTDKLALMDVSGLAIGSITLDALRQHNAGIVAIPDAATYTVLAANSGKLHTLPDLTADIVISLPTAAAGLAYEFVYTGAAADAQDWQFDTGSDTNFLIGGIVVFDDTADDEVGFFRSDGNSNSILNVLTPDVGTRVALICDGTNWILDGRVVSASDATFADQS